MTRGAYVIEQNLSVSSAVAGTPLKVPSIQLLPHTPEAERRMDQRLAEARIGEFAILNPGAGWGAKRWPAERYGRAAQALAAQGVRSILNYGPGEEELAGAAAGAGEGAAGAMKCSVTEMIALTRRGRPVLGGDTGPMHFPAAPQNPV